MTALIAMYLTTSNFSFVMALVTANSETILTLTKMGKARDPSSCHKEANYYKVY